MTREKIFQTVSRNLVEMFELDPKIVTMESRLVEELDLDSIDAIDLASKLQEILGRRLAEDDLRKIRTVADVVDVIERYAVPNPDRTP
jgi:acyl carrier protein